MYGADRNILKVKVLR